MVMNIEDAKTLIEGLRGRIGALSSSDKTMIAELYEQVLGKPFRKTSCNDCYKDAVILVYTHLKKHGTMVSQLQYRLRAGYLINSPLFHDGKVYSNANLTDEVAKEYLQMFPQKAVFFDHIPDPKPKRKNKGKRK
jgi:hypothetical protein